MFGCADIWVQDCARALVALLDRDNHRVARVEPDRMIAVAQGRARVLIARPIGERKAPALGIRER